MRSGLHTSYLFHSRTTLRASHRGGEQRIVDGTAALIVEPRDSEEGDGGGGGGRREPPEAEARRVERGADAEDRADHEQDELDRATGVRLVGRARDCDGDAQPDADEADGADAGDDEEGEEDGVELAS